MVIRIHLLFHPLTGAPTHIFTIDFIPVTGYCSGI